MPRKSRKNIGLIGLGIIGSRVAVALRAAGYNVYVWSRTPHAEPNFLGSPSEIAEVANIIHVFVSDAAAVYEVIEMFEDKLTPRHIIICNATIGPDATIEAARRIAEMGARFVDAPFTGSRDAAAVGELVYYLGGENEVLDAVEPVLRASSKALVRVGHIGQAAAVKISTNLLVAVMTQALAESVAVMQSAGVNPVVLEDALEHHAVHSRLIDMKLPTMLSGDFEPHFSLRNLSKDVQLALALANNRQIELPACSATAGVLHQGLHQGWGDLDFSALIKAYEAKPAPTVKLTHPEEQGGVNQITEVPGAEAGEAEVESALSKESPVNDANVEKSDSEEGTLHPEENEPGVPHGDDPEGTESPTSRGAVPDDLEDENTHGVPAPPEPLSSTPPHGDPILNEPSSLAKETGNVNERISPDAEPLGRKKQETPKTGSSISDSGKVASHVEPTVRENEGLRGTSPKSGFLRRLFQ